MRISDWSSDVCSSDLLAGAEKAGDDGNREAGIDLFGHGLLLRVPSISGCRPAKSRAGLQSPIVQPGGHGAMAPHALDIGHQAASLKQPASSRSEEHTSELQSLMRISYAVFCLKKKIT